MVDVKRGGARKLESDFPSIRHIVGGRRGPGHEESRVKVSVRGDTKIEFMSTIQFRIEMYYVK